MSNYPLLDLLYHKRKIITIKNKREIYKILCIDLEKMHKKPRRERFAAELNCDYRFIWKPFCVLLIKVSMCILIVPVGRHRKISFPLDGAAGQNQL